MVYVLLSCVFLPLVGHANRAHADYAAGVYDAQAVLPMFGSDVHDISSAEESLRCPLAVGTPSETSSLAIIPMVIDN